MNIDVFMCFFRSHLRFFCLLTSYYKSLYYHAGVYIVEIYTITITIYLKVTKYGVVVAVRPPRNKGLQVLSEDVEQLKLVYWMTRF